MTLLGLPIERTCLDYLCVSLSLSLANIPLSPETAQDQERRIRREIANSNERRRMQSINAGFQSLKSLLPHTDGEKLSKVQPTRTDSQAILLYCLLAVVLLKYAIYQKVIA